MKTLATLSFLLACSSCLADTWQLLDGKTISGTLKGVTPGQLHYETAGKSQILALEKLHPVALNQLTSSLGLSPKASLPVSNASVPTPATLRLSAKSSHAIDATQIDLIDAQFGKETLISGQVEKVIKLGSTGHYRVQFTNTPFHLFINKKIIASTTAETIESLVGHTIEVKGEIGRYEEQLQIALERLDQIATIQP